MLREMWLGLKRFWALRWLIKGPILAVAALIVLVIIAGVLGGGEEEGKEEDSAAVVQAGTATPQATAAAEPTLEPTPTAEPTPEPSWETGPVTEETVREALDDLDDLGLIRPDIDKDNTTFLSVVPHWETDGYIVAIEFEPGTVWSETDFLTVAGESTLIAMAKLFANPDVDRVKISAMAELTDALGNKSTEFLTTATIDRATADEINWQGFADRQSLDNKHIFCYADAYIIRSLIYDKLKDKGCLPGPSRSEG